MTEVFIHGLGQGPDSWAGVRSRLPAGGEAFVPDLPRLAGGRSAEYAVLYGALARELDALEGPLALCGLSLGAVLALNYALGPAAARARARAHRAAVPGCRGCCWACSRPCSA